MATGLQRARARLALLSLAFASAGATLHCGSCDDASHGDLGIDGGQIDDGQIDGGQIDGGPIDADGAANNSYDEDTGIGYLSQTMNPPKMDVLWVIDNSGSLCEEQRALRENFSRFATRLIDRGVDFNMGVTTTQMDSYPLEPVAEPGHIQSTPQPMPSPLPVCHGDEGDPNDPRDGFEPIRDSIATAVGCTKDPSAWAQLLDVTDDEIACALNPGGDGECGRHEVLFPTEDEDGTSPYREIPRVIRSSAYDSVNKVDVERLSRDFACMSMVGTRGHSVEKGLGAAVAAVSPELTGGAVESPQDASAPNHGLIRADAEFALVFLTDENDCTHDGSLDEHTSCGGDVCAFANHPDFPDSPLIDPSTLADDFVANLSATKGREIDLDELTIASMHGQWKRYGEDADYPQGDAPMSLDFCSDIRAPDPDIEEKPSCINLQTTAFSGDRYERFLRNFPRTYPMAPGGEFEEHMPGLICTPDMIPDALEQIGETSAPFNPNCVGRDLIECGEASSATACPAHRFGSGEPACVEHPAQDMICDSAFELQLIAPTDASNARAALLDTGLCITESIGEDDLARGCAVERTLYEVTMCNGGGTGFRWSDDRRYFHMLQGFEVRMRYLTTEFEAQ